VGILESPLEGLGAHARSEQQLLLILLDLLALIEYGLVRRPDPRELDLDRETVAPGLAQAGANDLIETEHPARLGGVVIQTVTQSGHERRQNRRQNRNPSGRYHL
jgi:hypothetical protein